MRHTSTLLAPTLLLSACTLLLSGSVLAHGDHPHPPGEPTDHSHSEPPPPAPLQSEGAPKSDTPNSDTPNSDKAKTTPPAATAEPAPVSAPAPDTADDGWRPKTLDDTSWRHAVREKDSDGGSEFTDFGHFYFELRFGPYSPNVDDDPAAGGVYAEYFGSDPLFYFGLEVDWLPLYIPYVGSLGPGFGWGFTSASGKTKVQGTETDAGSDTGLTIFPMHVSAVFRADGMLRELFIPIVPYIKGGLGFGIWEASGPNADTAAVSPEGTSTGLHLAIGGALALNAFDRSAAMAMREATGIRYANLWGEWMLDDLGGEGDLLVGTSTVVFGLALDF